MSGRPGPARRHGAWLPPAIVGLVTALAVAVAAATSAVPWTLTMDTGSVFLGLTVPAFRSWAHGQIPEWSDLLWGGYPVLADCTAATLYPPHVIAYVTTLAAPLRFFDVAFALHVGLLAAGSAWLVQVLGAGRRATVLGGVLGALCPFAHYCGIAFFPVLGAQAWWPWAFAAAERLAQPATATLGPAMMLGWVALAAQVLVGVPEQATYSGVVIALWLLTRRTRLGLGPRIVRLSLLAIGAAALASPQLLPTLLLVPATARSSPVTAESTPIVLAEPIRLFLAGTGVNNAVPSFLGIATLGLAAVAVVARRPRAAFLVTVALVAFLLSLGSAGGLHQWLRRVPPFDHFRSPVKFFALAELGIVWSAALGFDVVRRSTHRGGRMALVALALAALAERGVYVADEIPAFRGIHASDGLEPDAFATLERVAPLLGRRAGAPPPLIYDLGGPVGGRYARSLGALVGVASMRAGLVALLSERHIQLLSGAPRSRALFTLLGVRYLLVPTPRCDDAATRFRWPLLESTAELCIFRNPENPPHHELLSNAIAVASTAEMIDDLRLHPDEPVPVVAPSEAVRDVSAGTIEIERYAPGSASLLATVRGRGMLLVRDSLAPGWTVEVNGARVTPYPAAGLYFAVALGPGPQHVRVEYRTPGFRTGLVVLVLWVAGVTIAARRTRRPAAS